MIYNKLVVKLGVNISAMKRIILFKLSLWLTILVGCSGLLTGTPQPVIGQTNSPQFVENSAELEEAKQLQQQANQLYQRGRYAAAIPLIQRSLILLKKIWGINHLDVATSLNNLALLYKAQGRYREAEPLYQQSLTITKNLFGSEHPRVAIGLNNLGVLYYHQGYYSKVEPLYQQALKIRENSLESSHPDIAQSLNNLAELYHFQARHAEAEALSKRAINICETALGVDHPLTAISLNNLAEIYRSQGRYTEAKPLYKRAINIFKTALGLEHPWISNTFNNLALLYYSQGHYDDAEYLYKRALNILENALESDHPLTATLLNNLAKLYQEQGRYADAEYLYKTALEMREKILGSDHPYTAQSLSGLAKLYRYQGRYTEAESHYKRALMIVEKALGNSHPSVATSLNNLATLYSSQKRYSEAESLYKRALIINEKLLGIDHPDVATALNNLAALYSSQGRYRDAEPLYKRSLSIWEKALGTYHPSIATSLNNLAEFYQTQGEITQALNFLSRGLEVEEQHLNVLLATGSERQKQESMKTILATTYQAVSLHLQDAPNNSQAAHLALTTILRRKGRILDVVTNDLQLLRENTTPENQRFLDELQAVRTELSALIYNKPEHLSLEEYHQKVATLKTKADNLEAELSHRSSEFKTIYEPVTIETVRQFIPANAALVELVLYKPFDTQANQRGKPHYAAYILKASGELQWVDLGEVEPIHRAAFFEFSLEIQNRKDAFLGNINPAKKAGRKLDELLMKPIREKLGDVGHIILSPDAQLNRIPFAALVDENNQYLIENYKITYLTTGRDLLRLNNEFPHRQPPVILANPDYDNPGEPTPVPVATTRASNALSREVKMSFGALPGTAEEAKVIAPLFPDVILFTESQATENVIKQLEAPQVLHIATHGFFLKNIPDFISNNSRDFYPENTRVSIPPQENPLLRSGLALAGVNPRESGSEDGVLTALEVASLRLRGTKLVVLSACETGLGEIENGEGVYGLRRAFTLAGAESQLMSLWTVSDAGTKELMIKYYRRLMQNQGRFEAWRQTQLEMLNSQQYQHPYYWAAFIPVGDWTAME